jgi:flagellar hook-associated protein 3 FlgL
MRLSTQTFFQNSSTAIIDINSQVQRLQQQISSGERLLTAADDPVAAARILQLESELGKSDQYKRNIDLAEGRLQLIEGSVAGVEDIIQRVRELVIQSGNGALTNNERTQIATEIEERTKQLVDLTNTRDSGGDYIFGGFNVDAPAFAENASGFDYQGDEGVRLVQIANSSYVAISESGERLFSDIPVSRNEVATTAVSANLGGVAITSAEITDQAAFDAVFPEDFVVTFDGAAVATDGAYNAASGITLSGFTLELDGVPQQGDQFVVQSTNTSDMLTTVQRIARDMATFNNSTDRDAFIADALNDLDSVFDTLSQGRSRIGARLNTIESTRNTLEITDVNNQATLSSIRDLDYNEAISQLSFQSFVLEAAQQSFVRVSNLSLFNFLR